MIFLNKSPKIKNKFIFTIASLLLLVFLLGQVSTSSIFFYDNSNSEIETSLEDSDNDQLLAYTITNKNACHYQHNIQLQFESNQSRTSQYLIPDTRASPHLSS